MQTIWPGAPRADDRPAQPRGARVTDGRSRSHRLARAFDTPASKTRYVRQLFGTIAPRYDLITRLLSFGRDQHWKNRLLELSDAGAGSRVLDLACGTGDLALRAAPRAAAVIGLDVVPGMIARARARPGADRVRWLVGDMTALPFGSASCDVVMTGYGLRNASDLSAAIAEAHRVLAPGGRLCALDFERPESRVLRAVYLAYLTIVGSAMGWALHGDPDTYRYIAASIRRYPGARRVAALLRTAGFTDVRQLPVFGGLLAIHVARRD